MVNLYFKYIYLPIILCLKLLQDSVNTGFLFGNYLGYHIVSQCNHKVSNIEKLQLYVVCNKILQLLLI